MIRLAGNLSESSWLTQGGRLLLQRWPAELGHFQILAAEAFVGHSSKTVVACGVCGAEEVQGGEEARGVQQGEKVQGARGEHRCQRGAAG